MNSGLIFVHPKSQTWPDFSVGPRYNTIEQTFCSNNIPGGIHDTWCYYCVKYFGTIHKSPLVHGSGISYWEHTHTTYTLISLLPVNLIFCSDCRTTMLIYALVTEVYPANLRGWTSRSSDLREDGLFIYTVCLGSSESQCWEFHHAVYGTNVWSPPRCTLTLTRLRRSHFHVWQWCSVCNLQDTFLGLLVTL